MSVDHLAQQDFERAVRKSFWRKILTRFRGETNELLPYDDVREKIQIQGQRYIGLREVPVNLIVGSVGRYRDFDRQFLPVQRRTRGRWVNIDIAHYEQIPLPPVELYKVGEIYFVKDGNHRVSVARERGQDYVDAYITEIDLPVVLTPDLSLADLDQKKEKAEFILKTKITKSIPDANIEVTKKGGYTRILEHIDVHRWYLGERENAEVPYDVAVTSWYDHVYLPVIKIIRDQNLLDSFPDLNEADLYLWILEYAGYLRQLYQVDEAPSAKKHKEAQQEIINSYPYPETRKIIQIANKDNWLNNLILQQEEAAFIECTNIHHLRPDAEIKFSLPGQYDQLLEHIAVHRWYLGEQSKVEVSNDEAVISWYDRVYLPIVTLIREQEIMQDFPNRTEADLYLWIVRRRSALSEIYGGETPIERAIEDVTAEKDKSQD